MRVDLINVLPEDLPVSLLEAKAHVRIDYNKEDDLINSLIRTATEFVEKYTGQSLITRQITLLVQKKDCEKITLLYPPILDTIVDEETVSPIVAVYTGTTENVYTVTTVYTVWGLTERVITIGGENIKVVYNAGYGAASDVPLVFKEAILKLVYDMWEHRGESVTGTISQYTKQSIARLLYSQRKNILC
jgi:uncharacterized phiE125 gp8 family phage protein